MYLKTGKVYLTGGGCGDIGLLTLKAQHVLQSCDVVVYDSLVSEDLLRWTKAGCEKIYVGKRYGSHVMGQQEINALLMEKAQAGKIVVRLKGGDPYVFGRGGEEFLALQEAGICCEEVPGITSAIAVPAAAGIPVTHRGLSSSVTVVTGTAAEESGQAQLHMDFETLARIDGTLVILMGMHHLREIAEGLVAAGKNPDTPCAIIMEGTTRKQRCMRTVLANIATEAAAQKFTSPAVIVIGAVAALELTPEKREPELMGITAGVTGTPRFVKKVSAALAGAGIEAWDMGFMEIRPGAAPIPALPEGGWLVFTSPNGVSVFLDKMRKEGRDLRTLYAKKLAVIGPGTEAALKEAGLYADYMPQVYDAVHLAEGLTERIRMEDAGRGMMASVVFLRAKQGSDMLPGIFDKKGIPFLDHPLYELGVDEEKRAAVLTKKPGYIIFGSAMGVRAYFEGMEQAGITNDESRYVCIGEMCAAELEKYTTSDYLTAQEPGVEALVACLDRSRSS